MLSIFNYTIGRHDTEIVTTTREPDYDIFKNKYGITERFGNP